MTGQNIMTGSKLCWEAIFCQGTICRFCPDAILRPDEIFSMDESGVTVYDYAICYDNSLKKPIKKRYYC